MAALSEKEVAAKQQYNEVSMQTSALSKELTALTAEPTDSELDVELARMEAEANDKETKVSNLSGAKPVDPKQRAKTLTDFKKYRTVWIERKRKATDFMDVLSENMNKKMKDVVVMFCLHTTDQLVTALDQFNAVCVAVCRISWAWRRMRLLGSSFQMQSETVHEQHSQQFLHV